MNINSGDWCMFNAIDLTGVVRIEARISARNTAEKTIEVRVGSTTGALLGTITFPGTGRSTYATAYGNLDTSNVSGTQDLYFVFSGGFNVNWFYLETESLSVSDNIKDDQISYYPNPVSNNVTVLIPTSKFSHYSIFDISGRVNKQGVITSEMQKMNIDLSNFSKGIYLISLKGNQLTKTFKLVKN
ncbi:carbohydrate-binding protein [Flavivirga aquimarina]|uniref:Carbohydrate-binding protein n=1 Tax=Flavivirga aquimarina TaxID=2027862 RepID=A0ABT8WFI8_9FLAO|nr:carbohydrate-binding protein [Flavivirga aquimarina]MDO5971771.1 carbohydrate-binding protein [Flavivirga aquimarina]